MIHGMVRDMRTLLLAALLVAGCKHETKHHLAQTARECGKGDLGCPRTILYVDDLAASQRYYRDKLGFKIDWTDGDPPDFGAVSRGDAQIFMCQRCQGHAGSWLWVFTLPLALAGAAAVYAMLIAGAEKLLLRREPEVLERILWSPA